MKKGSHQTEESKQKISIAFKGKGNPNFGKRLSEEHRTRISQTLKEKGIKPQTPFKAYGINHPMFGKHHSEESNQKNRDAHMNKVPWNKGKHGYLSKEALQRMSSKGREPWNKGKESTEETRKKISESLQGLRGEKARRWKGGSKLSNARRYNKRRESGFGFIPLNDCEFDTWVGHHLDKEHVLYIPKELHESTRHSVTDNIRMDIINEKAIDWYIDYYGLM